MLLDTNAYLRLAKRIKPLLGVPFGQKNYVLTILKEVEAEVSRSSRLQFHYPWFGDAELALERVSKRVRLRKSERAQIDAAKSILLSHVQENVDSYVTKGRSPPSGTDCFCLAFGLVRPAIVTTDDLGMHRLAQDFDIRIWHGHELLKKMLTAKLIDRALVVDIFEALELNDDLPDTWRTVKFTAFKKIFGRRR